MADIAKNGVSIAHLREIGRKGGKARARQVDMGELGRLGGLATAQKHGVDHMREIGSRGGVAYVQRYGRRKLADLARQHRLAHPSELEQRVEAALVTLGYTDYEREGWLFPNSSCHHETGDFVFRARKKVIMADGSTWHTNGDFQGARAARDRAVEAYLAYRGWRILRLTESEIKAGGEELRTKIRDFLEESP